MREEDLVKELRDFDPMLVSPQECAIGWKALAREAGFSVRTLQVYCKTFSVELPRWGFSKGETTPVYLPKAKIAVLRAHILASS